VPDVTSEASRSAKLQEPIQTHRGKVVIVTAGTSDQPVAEEARETALWTGAVSPPTSTMYFPEQMVRASTSSTSAAGRVAGGRLAPK